MFEGIIGKFILFWIFMIGAIFFSRILGFATDTKTTGLYLGACALVYIVWVGARSLSRKRREK